MLKPYMSIRGNYSKSKNKTYFAFGFLSLCVGFLLFTLFKIPPEVKAVPGALNINTTTPGTTYFPGNGVWTSAGNVGIGTTAPGQKLDIQGGSVNISGNVTAQQFIDAANSAYLLDPANTGNSLLVAGNIGIGTTGPGYKLDVAGTIRSSSGGVVFPDGTTQTTSAAIPSGIVAFFNLASCPSGWTEVTAARGRYIVGLPASGTLAGTDGTALSNLEDRPTGQHSHSINDPGHTHTVTTLSNNALAFSSAVAFMSTGVGGTTQNISGAALSTTTGITINNAGSVAGTNAPYIQFLVCQKS